MGGGDPGEPLLGGTCCRCPTFEGGKRDGAQRASSLHNTQGQAAKAAKDIASHTAWTPCPPCPKTWGPPSIASTAQS